MAAVCLLYADGNAQDATSAVIRQGNLEYSVQIQSDHMLKLF
jgi:hypothetical protein